MRIIMSLWLFLIPYLANLFCSHVVLVAGQCIRDQRSLLLQLKSGLNFNVNQSVHLVKWSQDTDCCNWSGVNCDGGGRVTGLNLSFESITGGIENSTGLFGLRHLRRLNLASNSFREAQIPSKLASLTNLTYLNLSKAGFVGQIPIEISSLTRLVTLDLSCYRSGSLQLENPNLKVLVQNFSELRELYLDRVNISAHGNEWGQALSSSLPNLQVLSLSNCYLSGPIHSSLADLQSLSVIRLDANDLSSSVPEFLGYFPSLTILSLAYCGLYGKLPENIFKVSTLETIDLSDNYFHRDSFPDFPQNNSLRTLVLHNTSLSGTLPHSIGNLKSLSTLDLERCNFSGPLPTSMANLTQLEHLLLSSNNFSGSIPSFNMSKSLNSLDLSHNVLSGGISSTEWEQLQDLSWVDLSFNFLNGTIPPSLFALPLLQYLDLSNNQFEGQITEFLNASSSVFSDLDLSVNRLEGPIPMSIFELKNLESLDLSSNKFNGTVQLDVIGRLANLSYFHLSYNNLAVNVNTSFSSFPSNIWQLRLASCKLVMFPNLKKVSFIAELDLSDNQISGEIPNWIWEVVEFSLNLSHNSLVGFQEPYSFTNLQLLDLHSNRLQGKIPPPRAEFVDYSSNNFTSSIPDDIGNIAHSMFFFSVSNNELTGVIPESLCNATRLQVLDLSSNNLSGRIPTCLIDGEVNLGVLNVRRNSLYGTIPDKFPVNCGLQTLSLNGNELEGLVPKSLANCTTLEVLDLGNNKINDAFPCWLKNVSSLHVLVLRSNKFYGNISCLEYDVSWPMIQIIDIASNNFTGRLPQKGLTTWEAMMVDEHKAQSQLKHLQFEKMTVNGNPLYKDSVTVTMKGLEIELVKILTLFTSIDLSSNNFQGPIPEEIELLKLLYVLNLSHNALMGSIPSSIGKLGQLESLDLSVNNLSGEIPTQLASLNFLSFLNLSYNHLVGKIPSGTQLQSFTSISFEGNEGLYGPPLTNDDRTTNSNDDGTTNSSELPAASSNGFEFDWQVIIAIGAGFGVGFGAAVASPVYFKKIDIWYDILIHKFILSIRHG